MNETTSSRQADPASWLDEHGDALFRFALMRVHDQNAAEDLVQETFLSALGAYDRFEHRSSVRTWLIGILRNKIVDHFRRSGRVTAADEAAFEKKAVSDFFDETDHWRVPPGDWGTEPDLSTENREFWNTFERCVLKLPQTLVDAFCLRDLYDCQADEVCRVLDVSETNLSVRTYRARMLLRKCLEFNWFLPDR